MALIVPVQNATTTDEVSVLIVVSIEARTPGQGIVSMKLLHRKLKYANVQKSTQKVRKYAAA